MYATFAGMNMILQLAMLTMALLLEPLLKTFQTIGVAHCVVLTNQIFQKRKMKKGILFFFSFFFFSIYSQQNSSSPTFSDEFQVGRSNFRGGIRGGFTASQITKDGFAFQGFNKFGGYGGAFVNFPISRNGKWKIQPELNFIMKGCKHTPKTDEDGIMHGDAYRLQLMYGEMALLGKWRFFKGLELELGPAFNILFKNIDIEKVNGYTNLGAPPFARFEFAGIIGLNYIFFNHLGVDLRFEGSLLPVRKYRASHWIYLMGGQFNQTFCFSIYYQF